MIPSVSDYLFGNEDELAVHVCCALITCQNEKSELQACLQWRVLNGKVAIATTEVTFVVHRHAEQSKLQILVR